MEPIHTYTPHHSLSVDPSPLFPQETLGSAEEDGHAEGPEGEKKDMYILVLTHFNLQQLASSNLIKHCICIQNYNFQK